MLSKFFFPYRLFDIFIKLILNLTYNYIYQLKSLDYVFKLTKEKEKKNSHST